MITKIPYQESMLQIIRTCKKLEKVQSLRANSETFSNNKIFFNLFTNLNYEVKTNLLSLKESVMNKTLRNCFEKWKNQSFKDLNGRCKQPTEFFKFLFEDLINKKNNTSKEK